MKFVLPFASVPSDSIAGQWSRVMPSLSLLLYKYS
nr:MAG TPA: hypothetical protein [Caudoviricetes sp.]